MTSYNHFLEIKNIKFFPKTFLSVLRWPEHRVSLPSWCSKEPAGNRLSRVTASSGHTALERRHSEGVCTHTYTHGPGELVMGQ